MKKEKIIEFIKELVCYLIVLVILLLIANKLGGQALLSWIMSSG